MPQNPYPRLLAAAIEAAGATVLDPGRPSWGWLVRNRHHVDVLHLHWLHVFYRFDHDELRSLLHALGLAARMFTARLLGYRIVWTLHDPRSYDSTTPLADRVARLALMNLAEIVIHCDAARGLLRGRKFLGGVHLIAHGSYVGVYPDTVSRERARARLGIESDQVVFLAFGLIRSYKGLRGLIEGFERVTSDPGLACRVMLLVVGQPRTPRDDDEIQKLRSSVRHTRVLWHLEYVPDEDVQVFMRAADFAVNAFEEILVSGSAILALSFGLPLIAPNLGCLPELLAGGAGLLYQPPDGLSHAIQAALDADRDRLATATRKRAQELDWAAIGRQHVRVYSGERQLWSRSAR